VSSLGVGSVQLNAAPPLRIEARVPLTGDGLLLTLMPQQNVTAGLRWQQDRMFLVADTGFWDIPSTGPARWYSVPSILVIGLRAGDVDRDGDQDLMLFTMDAAAPEEDAGSPIVTHLSVWERTAGGLAQRSQILGAPGLPLPMPFVFGDPDRDGDLDILAYELGAPVVYVHDGAFGFERQVRGATDPVHADKPRGWVEYADRDRDGVPDLLVITGQSTELEAFVLRGDGSGRFALPGTRTPLMPTLVPHGPEGTGLGMADVTGDGLSDILIQDPSAAGGTPALLLRASSGPSEFRPPVALPSLGFAFADVDHDGLTDLVTTQNDLLVLMLARGNGAFETRDTGVRMAGPAVKSFAVDPEHATAYILYAGPGCPTCPVGCAGSCLFGACLPCLSNVDCQTR
jgi:hypothetical protein